MMAKQLFTYTIIFLLFTVGYLQAKDIDILKIGSQVVKTKPGEICPVVYEIENTSNIDKTVNTKLDLPEGWQTVTGTGKLKIDANSIKRGLFSFKVPKYTQVGKYKVYFFALEQNGDTATLTIEVEVLKVVHIEVKPVNSKGYVMAGEKVVAEYIVSNQGNSTEFIEFTPSLGVLRGANPVKLKSGESTVVKVEGKTNKDIPGVSNISIYLIAQVSGSRNVKTNAYTSIKIIPVKEVKNDLFFRFPVDVSLRYLMRDYHEGFAYGFQGQIFGDGFLDLDHTKRLTFLVRGPNQFSMSVLGFYDRYYAEYRQKEFNIFLGDKNYMLSPLTEMSRYGRGIEAQGFTGKFHYGGFYQQPRFYPDIIDETAVYGDFRFYKENTIGVSYLRKKYSESKGISNLYSINMKLQPFKNSLWDIELSKGNTGGKSGWGFYTNFIGNWNRVNVSAMLLYAGKEYPGYYTNSLLYTGSVNWRITHKLSFNASFRQDFQNASQDTLFGTAPYTQGYYAGFGYRFSRNIDVRIYYDHVERMDRATIKKFHYIENRFRLYYSHQIRNFSYYINGEIGKNENLLITSGDRMSNSYRASTDLNYDLNNWFQISAMVSFMSNNRYSQEVQNTWVYGGSLSTIINRNLNFYIHYQNDYEIEEYYRNRSLFSATLDWRITRNHELNFMANYALMQKQLHEKDYSIACTYTWHLGVPLKKTGKAGTVNGSILSGLRDDMSGLIIFINGHTVVTDKEGNFEIKNLKPGTYYLFIDKSTIGVHELPDIPEPIKVDVIDGEETFITFGLTTAAKVTGNIEIKGKKSNLKILDDGDKPGNVILELKNGKESFKIITNDDGTFSFPDVRPGKWTLKVYPGGLSDKYKIKQNEFKLDLKPGDKIEVPVTLIKKQRKIIFTTHFPVNLSGGGPKSSEKR